MSKWSIEKLKNHKGMLGKHHTAEAGRKMSQTKKRLFSEGKIISTWKGKKLPQEMVEKIRNGRIRFFERGGKIIGMLGKHHTEITKQKLREKRKNQIFTEETRKKQIDGIKRFYKTENGKKRKALSREKMLNNKFALGNKHTEEWKKIISEKESGEKHYNWQGGKSFEPYSTDWTQSLRRTIRERDRYTCQLCSKPQGDRVHSVHHIDHNKKNCNPNNLITLCAGCNTKVNYNRIYWIDYFKSKV